MALVEIFLDDAPSRTRGSKALTAPAKRLTGAPLLVEAFAAERARARSPGRTGGGGRGGNLGPLGDDKANWRKLQEGPGKEWNARRKRDAATRVPGDAVKKIDPDKTLNPKVVWTDKGPETFEPEAGHAETRRQHQRR